MNDLPLTVPVHSIVAVALRRLQRLDGLDRDEAYLLARLEGVPEEARTQALLDAVRDAEQDADVCPVCGGPWLAT